MRQVQACGVQGSRGPTPLGAQRSCTHRCAAQEYRTRPSFMFPPPHLGERGPKVELVRVATAEPGEPGPEEAPLEAQEPSHAGVVGDEGRVALPRPKGALQGVDGVVGLAVGGAVDDYHGDLPRGLQALKARRLVPVAGHVYALDPVRHALFLEAEPDLWTSTVARKCSFEEYYESGEIKAF